jgi:hypothetical protein
VIKRSRVHWPTGRGTRGTRPRLCTDRQTARLWARGNQPESVSQQATTADAAFCWVQLDEQPVALALHDWYGCRPPGPATQVSALRDRRAGSIQRCTSACQAGELPLAGLVLERRRRKTPGAPLRCAPCPSMVRAMSRPTQRLVAIHHVGLRSDLCLVGPWSAGQGPRLVR